MVDLRPLLFINLLLAMLLVTAGFVQTQSPEPLGATTPEAWVPQNNGATELSSRDEVSPNTQSSDSETQAPSADDPINNESVNTATRSEQQDMLKQAEQALFADEAIFVDEVQPPHKDSDAQTILSQFDTTQQNTETQPNVVSYSNTPKQTPLTTGKVVIRSNVHGDTVLINGKPYGPTMLEIELTPGSYDVEVAKSGYSSWTTQIDVRRGKTQNLNARLEHYTSVSYRNGVWQNNIQTGEGSYIEAGVLEYTGSFVNGKFHGSGVVRYANGMKYQGDWFEGNMKGQGSLTTTDGDTYIGELDDNKFSGEGTLTKATGDIYTGLWIDGVLNGQGSLTTKDGLLYVGGFSDNLFHGNGSLTYPDGGHYEGSFSNGLFHGKGVEVYPNGKKYVGQFIEGLYHGKGEIMNPNGSKITGTFKDGKPFGKATLTTTEGEVFTARSSEPGVCYRLKSYRATECPSLEGW